MSDSESSSGSSSSSGSESSSQSSSSVSSRSTASSKRSAQSAEFGREKQAAQESSSDSESSRSDSSKSSAGSLRKGASGIKEESSSSSESDSSRSSLARGPKTAVEETPRQRSASVSSASTRTSRTSRTSATSGSESSDSELARDSVRPKEQEGSSSSSESASSTHSSTSSDSESDSDSDSESDSSSSDGSTSTSSTASSKKQTADRDTIRIEKKAIEPIKENQIRVELGNEERVRIERRNSMDHMDAEEDPAIANNKWVRLGKTLDRFWFSRWFIPMVGSLSIFLLVVFSILLDIRISGEKGLPYGISMIFIMILLLFWSVLLTLMGLSRVRYALNIQMVPENGTLFEKSIFNKEGARIGAFYSFAIALLLFFVYTVLIAVHVDKGADSPWSSWSHVFIPLWIALGFIGLGITFSARLLKSYVTVFFHIAITASCTALCITIFNKIQGHIAASWYKVLVPLWFLDFFIAIAIMWHAISRVLSVMPHFVPTFSKSKKEREPDTARDALAAIPISIAGIFALLFQVACVIKTETVFVGKYHVTWSVIWLWWWLACAFAALWCWVYKYKVSTPASRAKRVSKV